MKEETAKTLEQALINILEKTTAGVERGAKAAAKGVEKGVEFLSAELPDVIYQLLLWHGVKSFVFFMVGILMYASSFFVVVFAIKQTKKDDFSWTKPAKYGDDDPSGYLFAQIGLYCLSCAFVTVGSLNINIEWVQVWLAPKVWLIEYAASLVK